jgi:hypothetical protein
VDENTEVESAWGPRPSSWKRRSIVALLGEERALSIADRYVDLRVWKGHTFTRTGRDDHARIKKYRNVHADGRCVIIGNGPSLRDTDLGLLRNEITFGLNRIYLMYDKLGFQTTYHVVVNELVVEQCVDDFRMLGAPLFTTTVNRGYLGDLSNVVCLTPLRGPRFARDVAHGVWEGGTVTYVAIQLAYYMGFKEVVLVGVDHRFAAKGPANKLVVSTEPDHSHFDPRYFGPGFRWQLPDLETSEIAYELAKHAYEKDGRSIVDATVDGALQIFPKMSLKAALG